MKEKINSWGQEFYQEHQPYEDERWNVSLLTEEGEDAVMAVYGYGLAHKIKEDLDLCQRVYMLSVGGRDRTDLLRDRHFFRVVHSALVEPQVRLNYAEIVKNHTSFNAVRTEKGKEDIPLDYLDNLLTSYVLEQSTLGG